MAASLITVLLAAAALAGSEAAPKGVTLAELRTPAPTEQVIDGRIWRCGPEGCRADASAAAESQPLLRECRRAAAKLGAFTRYATGARALGDDDLATCNQSARKATASGVETAAR